MRVTERPFLISHFTTRIYHNGLSSLGSAFIPATGHADLSVAPPTRQVQAVFRARPSLRTAISSQMIWHGLKVDEIQSPRRVALTVKLKPATKLTSQIDLSSPFCPRPWRPHREKNAGVVTGALPQKSAVNSEIYDFFCDPANVENGAVYIDSIHHRVVLVTDKTKVNDEFERKFDFKISCGVASKSCQLARIPSSTLPQLPDETYNKVFIAPTASVALDTGLQKQVVPPTYAQSLDQNYVYCLNGLFFSVPNTAEDGKFKRLTPELKEHLCKLGFTYNTAKALDEALQRNRDAEEVSVVITYNGYHPMRIEFDRGDSSKKIMVQTQRGNVEAQLRKPIPRPVAMRYYDVDIQIYKALEKIFLVEWVEWECGEKLQLSEGQLWYQAALEKFRTRHAATRAFMDEAYRYLEQAQNTNKDAQSFTAEVDLSSNDDLNRAQTWLKDIGAIFVNTHNPEKMIITPFGQHLLFYLKTGKFIRGDEMVHPIRHVRAKAMLARLERLFTPAELYSFKRWLGYFPATYPTSYDDVPRITDKTVIAKVFAPQLSEVPEESLSEVAERKGVVIFSYDLPLKTKRKLVEMGLFFLGYDEDRDRLDIYPTDFGQDVLTLLQNGKLDSDYSRLEFAPEH